MRGEKVRQRDAYKFGVIYAHVRQVAGLATCVTKGDREMNLHRVMVGDKLAFDGYSKLGVGPIT